MNYYTDVLKKYTVFSGRARRQEYWMFTLFNLIALIIVAVLDNAIGTYPLLYAIYALAVFLPGLAVGVRRLHDTGKSGWWMFIALVPLVGGIWLLVLMATEGQPQPNEYGQNPKAVQA
ncbi:MULTISPECIES: DUF805 domain-containing protein [unclassified Streptomyces]|uniref:DUF805 domain-containing protein n=1 Tax=unclassified Streptomyces TaxID=2593676 RepID=UPI00225499A6|nr:MULTISPECIES: DUF805 domain-containing protein [unclassified Streptomyces]MCX4626452.1 DUF805 domain-containing protein [Streptomyces sp. NBC_01443]WSW42655.1 DUF805 domain-containing protein [Streptomyces sp. NBC_01001]